ncbi:MAG: hypothetical protein HY234_14030 [Acidobacteria bacterium]|nr:hypothetical protein [Acidobacteriota bacterium]
MFCPICHAEYRKGFTRCTDCGVALVHQLETSASPLRNAAGDSAALLWRGGDPVTYAALIGALREARIPFYDSQTQDVGAGHSASVPFPSPFDATASFEIRVRHSDLKRAEHILDALLEQEPEDLAIGVAADGPAPAVRQLPDDWDPTEATVEIWSGHDAALARFLADIFRENGIPLRESVALPATHRLLVRPQDAPMARELLREIITGTPPS